MSAPENAVAIVGMAGRFPGADDLDRFWKNIRNGVSTISRFTDAELEDAFPRDVREAPNFVRARPILENVDRFDADFFGMLPREAALTDPQHRLLLECAWNALEDAGIDPSRVAGAVGVFAGCSMPTYLLTHVLAERLDPDRFASDYQVGSYDALVGSLPDALATRIAYKLNLRGPALTVQSACSTSLLAVSQACQSLLLYQSDIALAGGVSITFPQKRGYLHQEGGMVSPDGVCRPFDEKAGGTIFGDGAAMVALKRLQDALDAGDHIYAVIRGSAVNNDGSGKVGFTAPSVTGQAEVIAAALAAADVSPDSIGYVECHGTATPLGDPIEFAGLTEGFGGRAVQRPHCALGSAKANIGHLDVAAGVTGLIKAALALHHGEIPPLANFHSPSRHIDLSGSRFHFPTAPTAWPAQATPRRAGVSAFGVGGTNVHVVLEEAPARVEATRAQGRLVLPLSARTDAALVEMAGALADHLTTHPALALEDVAHTLQAGRRVFDRRAAVTGASRERIVEGLRAIASAPPSAAPTVEKAPLIFMFPGQGAQFPGMARALYDAHGAFRQIVDEGIAVAEPIVGPALRPQLLDSAADGGNATLLAQPSLFIFEYALARLWMSWGFEPDAMVGHSVGEFVAACIAGVFSFADGCRLVATRARLMQAMAPGAMLAVRLPEADLKAELGPTLDLAAINAPSFCVAAGPTEEIANLEARLTARGVSCRRLAVSHAFHSRTLDPILPDIERAAAATPLNPPVLPIASCVTGAWVETEATDPAYWARHGRAPVRFADALATATHGRRPFLLEVGPGRTLAALAPQAVDRKALQGVAAGVDAETNDLADALAALWTAGFTPDWEGLGVPQGRIVPLPTYRFQRSRHWIERSVSTRQPPAIVASAAPVIEAASPQTPAAAPGARDTIHDVVAILQDLSGIADIDPNETFVAQGFDSLLLGQVARAVEKKFRTKITFRQLLTDLPSVSRLVAHLEATGASASTASGTEARKTIPLPAVEMAPRVRVARPSAEPRHSLDERQRAYVADLVRRTNERTPVAKAQTQRDRGVLADPRTVAGFRLEWKELVYPLVAQRAKGSRLWDIDGNEYIDLVNGYGQTMFGHSPDFVTGAVAAQLQDGFPIGPQSPLAGEVAHLVSEMTGDERVTFCNTGSEAVMAAMRVARAVTGRERVVVFGNDYHGQFDEVLVKAGGGTTPRALPVAPGIPPEAVANMTVLPYGDPRSLDWIDANGEDIAAVMVEPVQSRHPALRPREFLEQLRGITEARGAALVFDEIVTGFRTHPGGMQALFGIRADLATYGKVVGGGMPVGILAGKARFMDALDGGMWRFGDESMPEVAPTFFAGTFVRHPLVLAATRAVLRHLKAQGPALQTALAARMDRLVGRLNADLERHGLATRAEGFSSWFYVNPAAEHPLATLFWPQARLLGVHVQEGYPCFLTTAHSDADIATIGDAFATSLDALEAGGILDAARAVRRAAPAARAALPANDVDISAPLTDPQLEVLTAAQMGAEASCAFNESISVDLGGELDAAALSRALDAMIARHQALRGRVGRDDERMHFASSLKLDLPVVDLTGEADADAALSALRAKDARTPFDLWDGPLVRATLARLSATRHVLVFTAHHIVCDGWSINILLNDLASLYRAERTGEPAALSPAPDFATYADSQAERKPARDADLAYWNGLYADIPPLPDLPTDRPRPPQRSFAGATWSTHFEADLAMAAKKAGAASGATLFAVLFTALQTVFAHLSGSSDIVMGVPVAGQSADDVPDLVGHCVQMLPLRAPLAWDTPFAAHVRNVSDRLLEGFDHPHCTYGTLVRSLKVVRDAGRLPLTEIQFNLERVAEGLDFGGVTAIVTPNPKAAVNFDIFVNVIESAEGLRIDCDYNTDLFDEGTVARWMAHYRRVLAGIGATPHKAMQDLPFLSPEQERFVLDGVNATAAEYPRDKCIHQLFSAQAVATPDAVACVDAAGAMSYGELDRRSTRLAQEMLGIHIARRGRVAIAVDRSRALPIALLGVMKSGHAYVPLDIAQPPERLKQIALAAQIDGIICQDDAIRAIAPYAFEIRIDRLDLDDRLDGKPLPPVPATDPAYILFTSGSTGTPKGVEIRHRSLTNLVSDIVDRCDVTANDVAIASSAITFDIAATEFFAPLVRGASVVLADTEQVRTVVELAALAKASHATLLQATPTLWRMLVEAGFESAPGLKMLTAGEPISQDLADRLLQGGGRLWNLYGPTEATIYASGCEMTPGQTNVTIGRPLANTQLYVLDERDRPVAPGTIGQLFIGGDGLATGYFDRSDLTALAFRDIALGGHPPRRLYATGDLAHLLPSGEFVLHGRIDSQVKLRGFRIELEEIETVLRKVPGVNDCAVLLRRDSGPEPMLVAYVAMTRGLDVSALSERVAATLPAYMQPSRWVFLEAMPLLPSGKVDRKALPMPVSVAIQPAPASRPKNATESRIAEIWAEVIGLPEVGIDDPLFSLGADSLQVFRIAAQLDRAGLAISARDLMRNPTIAALSRQLEQVPADVPAAKKGPSLADFRRGARRRAGTP